MKELLKKAINLIGISLDWINKNLSRIKTAGLLLLFVFFILSFISNGCNKRQAEVLFQRVTGLDLQNDILSLKNRTLQDSLNKEKVLRLQLEHSKQVLIKEKQVLETDNVRLKKRIADIPAWILNLPADSSYKFLIDIAYPFPGEKRFPFNEPQIKNMHADYLENVELTGLVTNLEDRLQVCEKLGANSDSLAASFNKSYLMAESQKSNMTDEIKNTQEKATLYKDALDKSEKRKKFWKTAAQISAAVAVVLAIF